MSSPHRVESVWVPDVTMDAGKNLRPYKRGRCLGDIVPALAENYYRCSPHIEWRPK